MTIRKSEIEKSTVDILESLGLMKAPINVESVAEKLSITIEYQDLDDTTSGFLVRRDANNIIGINISHPPVRQRFTLAHEIGHFKLHVDKALFVDYYKGSMIMRSEEKYSRQEMEANQFAAFILMPKRLISEAIKDLPENSDYESMLKRLSRLFEVSQQAMDYRLKALGLYDYGL